MMNAAAARLDRDQPDTFEVLKNLRWYYADTMMNLSVYGVFVSNPVAHLEFMDRHDLWRDQMPRWLDQATKAIEDHLLPTIDPVLKYYMNLGYTAAWAFDQLQKPQDPASNEYSACMALNKIWDEPNLFVPMKENFVLFEGQGNETKHEPVDLMYAQAGQVLIRKRPTAATWSLNAATWDMSMNYRSVLAVHHIVDPRVKALLAQKLTEARFGIGTDWVTCSVTLQPCLKFTIMHETQDRLDSYGQTHANAHRWENLVRVIHTCVEVE